MTGQYIFLFIILFLSSFLQGITGFGFALLAAPLGLLIFDQTTLIVIFSLIGVFLNSYLFLIIKSEVDRPLVNIFVSSGVIGLFSGIIFLKYTDPVLLKLFVGFIILSVSVFLLFKKPGFSVNRSIYIVSGILIGFLQSGVGVNGPLLAVILNASAKYNPTQLRKNLAIIFLFLNLLTFPLLLFSNILNPGNFMLGLTLLPGVFLGSFTGNLISPKINKKLFGIIYMGLIVLSSLVLIIENI